MNFSNDTAQAIKFSRAIEAGPSDANLATPDAYRGYSLHNHGDTMNSANASNSGFPSLHTPHFDVSLGGRRSHDLEASPDPQYGETPSGQHSSRSTTTST